MRVMDEVVPRGGGNQPVHGRVIEILDSVAGDQEASSSRPPLAEQGYTLALDNHERGEPSDPLLDLVSIVEDALALSRLQLEVERCAGPGWC